MKRRSKRWFVDRDRCQIQLFLRRRNMADSPELRDQIKTLFHTSLGLEIPSDDTDLFEAGILDSMSFVELLFHFENAFGITLSLAEVDFDHFRSLQKMAAFIAGRR